MIEDAVVDSQSPPRPQDPWDEGSAGADWEWPASSGSVSSGGTSPAGASLGSIWTIPLLFLGIGIIACCLIIPAADDNRRLTYQREQLQIELAQIQRQVDVNASFLHKLSIDPTLSERLARRQMKVVREGTGVLDLQGMPKDEISPFHLVAIPPPPQLPAYQPVGGKLAAICRNPKSQLYLLGVGLILVAVGLVSGPSRRAASFPQPAV